MSRDGTKVYATCERSQTVIELDVATEKIVRPFKSEQKIATIPCESFPIRVKFTPDGKARTGSPARGRNELAVFDVAKRKEIKRVKTGGFPVGVLIEPSGARAFVAFTADSIVAVYDLKTLEVVGKIAAGKQADGMALIVQP